MRIRLASLLLLAGLVVAGCGAVGRVTSGDAVQGKALFKSKCGACHTLADAGTTGAVGPNLDDAFGPDKKQGFSEQTIRDVVRGQIAYATSDPGQLLDGQPAPGMPDNLVVGKQADDVAVYVARCASAQHCDLNAK